MALVDQQLGGEMALLGELRLLEPLPLALEIGAGILQVGIEEQLIEPVVEIVVMGDVAPRPRRGRFAKSKRRRKKRTRRSALARPKCGIAERIARAERHEVVEIALRHLEAAVHVEFAQRQLGVEHQRPFGGGVGDANGEWRPRSIAERALGAIARSRLPGCRGE